MSQAEQPNEEALRPYERDLYPKRSRIYSLAMQGLRAIMAAKSSTVGTAAKMMPAHWAPRGNKYRDCAIAHRQIEGVKTWVVTPLHKQNPIALLYLHGGGFMSGPFHMQWRMMTELARNTGCTIYMPEYRLSPAHPFPAGLEDCLGTYETLSKEIDEVILIGDSAGGGLCLSVTELIKGRGLPWPKRLILISPWLYPGSDNPEMESLVGLDPMLKPHLLEECEKAYCPSGDFKNPLVSPFFANLKGFPPILILIGTWDVLYPDCQKFIHRAKDEGHDIHAIVAKDMIHVWLAGLGFYQESRTGLAQITAYILDVSLKKIPIE